MLILSAIIRNRHFPTMKRSLWNLTLPLLQQAARKRWNDSITRLKQAVYSYSLSSLMNVHDAEDVCMTAL